MWWRRPTRKLGSNCPSTGYSREELSEEEIIFDKSVMECNQEASKGVRPKTTADASSGRSRSVTSIYQPPDHSTQEQKIWTLTNTLRPCPTPLMAVPTLDDLPRTKVWTSEEIPETKSLDFSFTTTSLSDSSKVKPTETPFSVSLTSEPLISQASETEVCADSLATATLLSVQTNDLTDKTVLSTPLFTAQSMPGPSASPERTSFESLLSLHPSKPSVSLLPTASDESTPRIIMASDGTSSSTESFKTPVAVRKEVAITMDNDDEKIIFSSESEEESSVKSESESFSGEVFYTSQKADMKNVTKRDAIIDIIGGDNDTEETSAANEKLSSLSRAQPRDAVRPKSKREARWEDESTNPEDRGASTSTSEKIRVLNHKDYKTWKVRIDRIYA